VVSGLHATGRSPGGAGFHEAASAAVPVVAVGQEAPRPGPDVPGADLRLPAQYWHLWRGL